MGDRSVDLLHLVRDLRSLAVVPMYSVGGTSAVANEDVGLTALPDVLAVLGPHSSMCSDARVEYREQGNHSDLQLFL